MKSRIVLLFIFILSFNNVHAQERENRFGGKKNFISSSMFMLMNFALPDEPPRFYQLNYGRRLTDKDAIIVEAITWQYHAPIGIPYGGAKDTFPGIVRDYGVGLAYQRFLWKGLYSTFHATPFVQQYLTSSGQKIKSGFQLFLTLRAGYHFELFKNKLFIEPSIAFTHWPIETNMPASFTQVDKKWPNYFLFEPGLHVGFNF